MDFFLQHWPWFVGLAIACLVMADAPSGGTDDDHDSTDPTWASKKDWQHQVDLWTLEK